MYDFLKKDFLLGIGVGFIISAISIYGNGSLSDQEIKDRAAKLGMIFPDKSITSSQSGTKNRDGEAKPEGKITENNVKPAVQVPAAKNIKAPQDTTEAITKVPDEAVIVITSGMGSETISRILEEKGVIKDRDEFYRLISEHKAHTRFKDGTWRLPKGGNMEVILKLLTGR